MRERRQTNRQWRERQRKGKKGDKDWQPMIVRLMEPACSCCSARQAIAGAWRGALYPPCLSLHVLPAPQHTPLPPTSNLTLLILGLCNLRGCPCSAPHAACQHVSQFKSAFSSFCVAGCQPPSLDCKFPEVGVEHIVRAHRQLLTANELLVSPSACQMLLGVLYCYLHLTISMIPWEMFYILFYGRKAQGVGDELLTQVTQRTDGRAGV